MMPQLNDFLGQSGMSLPESLVKKQAEDKHESNGQEVIAES